MYRELSLSLERKQSKHILDSGISICGEEGYIAGEGAGTQPQVYSGVGGGRAARVVDQP